MAELLLETIGHLNLGGRASVVVESRVANVRELELSPASCVLSKEKTFRLSELGTQRLTKSKIKSPGIRLAMELHCISAQRHLKPGFNPLKWGSRHVGLILNK